VGKGNNHYPWCTCGWCSGGYRGGHGTGGSRYAPVFTRHFKEQRASDNSPTHWAWAAIPEFRTLDSFTNPNASCPKCGAPVFFYKSPYGGRVFFDSLGPPWPKHPCTDNAAERTAVTGAVPLRDGAMRGLNTEWLSQGWRPFFPVTQHEVRSSPGVWCIRGALHGTERVLYFRAIGWSEGALLHLLRDKTGRFLLSAALPTRDGNTHAVTLLTFDYLADAAAAGVQNVIVPNAKSVTPTPPPPPPVVPTPVAWHWAWSSLPEFLTLDDFTNPNALCPKCRAPVFYYRPSPTERIFFDSLGPPWPKHKCMDNDQAPGTYRSRTEARPRGA
jgi:hypothetical protein